MVGRSQIIRTDSALLDKLKQSVERYDKELTVFVDTKIVDVNRINHLFVEKYGTFYPNLISIDGSTKGFSTSSVMLCTFCFEYRIGKVKLSMMEVEVEKKIKELSEMMFLPDMPIESKILIAHNYLCATVHYNKDWENDLAMSYTQSAYGALIEKKCVCQGFAEAYKRLMDECNIWCETISGTVVGEDGSHAWNIINLGKTDSYHHVDVTWDAGGDRIDYTYFCKSDRFFEGKRNWNKTIYPKCSGRYAVLALGKPFIFKNRNRLLDNGIPPEVIA